MEQHISDQELLLELDGELQPGRAGAIRDHLTGCWTCRARRAELEQTIGEFVNVQYRALEVRIPDGDGARAMLRARMAEAGGEHQTGRMPIVWAAAAVVLVALGGMLTWLPMHKAGPIVERGAVPNGSVTPGAVRLVSKDTVCTADEGAEGRRVSVVMAQAVFTQYGIRDPQPRSYEVDYLIPPSLGGLEEVSNLWPQPYAGVWTARVKDALEDRLRAMVCDGSLDLATAQRDLARDWVGAYRKYFKTESPLLDHVAFVKDRPWE